MKPYLLDYLVVDIRRFGDISVLDVLTYKQYGVYNRRAYRELPRRRAVHMEEKVMIIEWLQTGERYKPSADIGTALKTVLNWSSPKCLEENCRLVQTF